MRYLTIATIALCNLGQTAYGLTIKLSDLPELAPAPPGTE